MKKLLMAIALLSGTLVFAQQNKGGSPEKRAEKMTEWMKTNLKLTDEQSTKVEALNLEYAKKNQELKEKTASREERMGQVRKNQDEKDEKLKAILTADQYKTYEMKKEEMKEEMKKKNAEGGGGGVKNG